MLPPTPVRLSSHTQNGNWRVFRAPLETSPEITACSRFAPPTLETPLRLLGRLRFAQPQSRAFDFCDVLIQRPRGRPAEYFATPAECRAMAGAREYSGLRVPMIGASQVRTQRCEYRDIVRRVFYYPGAVFCAADRPAVHPIAYKCNLSRRACWQIRNIPGVHPVAPRLAARRAK